MDRALFWDESLIVFIKIYCFLVFNFQFYFLQRYCTQLAPLCAIGGNPLANVPKVVGKLLANLLQVVKRVSATLWQICNRVSEVIGNPLPNSPEGIGNFCK
jgi:hypothetical protein